MDIHAKGDVTQIWAQQALLRGIEFSAYSNPFYEPCLCQQFWDKMAL